MVVVAFSESDTTATMVLPRNNNGSRLGSLFSLILMVNYLWVPSSVATATAAQSFDDMMVVSNVPLESQPEEDQRQQRYLRHSQKKTNDNRDICVIVEREDQKENNITRKPKTRKRRKRVRRTNRQRKA